MLFLQEEDQGVSESKEQLLELLERPLSHCFSGFLLDSGVFLSFGLALVAFCFFSGPLAAFGFFSGPLRLGGWLLRAAAQSFVSTTPSGAARLAQGQHDMRWLSAVVP